MHRNRTKDQQNMHSISDPLAAGTARVALFFCVVAAALGLVRPSAPAATNTANVCAMLSTADVSRMWGKTMAIEPMGMNLPGVAGCDWSAPDGHGLLTVRIVAASDYPDPSAAPGYATVRGIGDAANVLPSLGGWTAAARKGAKAVVVQVDGGRSNRSTALTVLKTVLSKV
jgi:hypothetical protein